MGVSLKDIAKLAEVSVATVSMVLRDYPIRCSKEKTAQIKQIAKDLNYTPNYAAVSLVKQKSSTIGVIIPDFNNVFFANLAKHLGRIINDNGYIMILCDSDNDFARGKKQLDVLKARNVDAMIFAFPFDRLSKEHDELIASINALDIPGIALDTNLDDLKCPCIAVDNQAGAALAVEHLIKNGHKKIAYLTGGVDSYTSRKRLEGCKKVLQTYGIPFDENFVVVGDYTFESGYARAKEVFDKDVTALFAFNDMMAYGVMSAAAKNGVVIPQDLSLVGFDDIIFSSMSSVPLTTVRQPVEKISMIAGNELFGAGHKIISSKFNRNFKVEPTLVKRDTVKRLRYSK